MDRTRWRIGALCLAWSLGACFPEPKIKGDTDPGDVDAATAEDTAGPVDTWVIDTSPGELDVRDTAEPVDTAPPDTVAPADTVAPTDTVEAGDTVTPIDTVEPADTVTPGDAVEPPAVPTAVVASVDRSSEVEVRWQGSAGAVSYRVERCAQDDCAPAAAWVAVTEEPLAATFYVDDDVSVPGAPPAPAVVATDDLPDEVLVTWDDVAAPPAPTYRYRVVAIGEGGESAPSEVAVGSAADRPVIGYEIRVDGGAWREVGLVTSWHDPEAAAPSLTAGLASASNGVYAEFVRLSVSGSAALSGSERSYQVRASTVYGPAASSASVVGSRSPGPLTRAWERSAGTTAQDFTALAGATGASFDDTGAPADGSVRWYRVVVRAEGAPDAVSEAVSGARQPPPGVPGGVAASSELEGYVLVTWAPVAGAVGYHVYRDGAKLTGAGAITQTSYQDAAVGAPVGSWAAPNTVVGSTSSSEEVSVSWRAPGRPLGPQASYTVSAVNAAGEGPLSAAAVGRRAAPALVGFEVEVTPAGGSASWYTTASTATTWVHADPPKGVITGGTISASQGSHRALVRLSSSGASVAQAAYVAYRVRGVLEGGGKTPISAAGSGRRAVGSLSRQWQRSAGTAASGWAVLSGATGASFDDASAPADGAKRWYRLALSAPGAEPVVLSPLEGWRLAFVQVAGGSVHTCALTNDGVVWCWGRGDGGQLGRGVFEGVEPVGPAPVPGLSGVVGVYAGHVSSCARTSGGQVWCWGGEYLGNGQRGSSPTPVQIAGLSGATSISIEEAHACAVFATGGVKCWGSGDAVLGDGTRADRLYPVSVKTTASTSLLGAAQVSTSWQHTCARLTSGQVWCWGWNEDGRIGVDWSGTSGSGGYALFAMQASAVTGVAEVSASASHSCARLQSGVIKCWGSSFEGLRGDGGVSEDGPTPSTVSGITTAVELSSTRSSTCARLASGGVRCWGGNYVGLLGNGSSAAFSNVPVTVSGGLSSATDLGSGWYHQCAVQGSDVWCWGDNRYGQLGAVAVSQDEYGHPFSKVPLKVGLP